VLPRARIATPLLALVVVVSGFHCRRTAQGEPPQALDAQPATVAPFALDALSDVTDEVDAEDVGVEAAPPPPKPRLGAKAQFLFVYGEPKKTSLKLGHLRAGAIVERDAQSAGDEKCPKGWYAIRPRGYVCLGDGATTEPDADPFFTMVVRRPDLRAPLPYSYGIARNSMSPFYARIPTRKEAAALEYDANEAYARSQRAAKSPASDAGPEYDAGTWSDGPPSFLLDGGVVPNVSGFVGSPRTLHVGRPKTKEGFAIVQSFVSGPAGAPPDGGVDDRRYDLTTDYLLVPHDRLREVRPSQFHGAVLDDANGLPVAFVRTRKHTTPLKLEGEKQDKIVADATPAAPRTLFFLDGKSKWIGGVEHLGTKDGRWVKASDVVKVEAPKILPGFAQKGDKWIDVSIARQSLIAFEGEKPVYVTLVSTGRDGLGDPESTHATIRGVYRIHTKYATMTMDSSEVGEAFSLRDVPYVMYFESGYALHAAYWHDGFGEPRSHGCINLPETDASWLFGWTGPELPEGWHGVFARPMTAGTQIWIHP
jgi:hypothetical protein